MIHSDERWFRLSEHRTGFDKWSPAGELSAGDFATRIDAALALSTVAGDAVKPARRVLAKRAT